MAVVHRQVNGNPGTLDPVYITGFCVAGAIMLGLVILAFITLIRRRAKAKRKSISHGAFLSIRGVVKEGMLSQYEKTSSAFQNSVQMRSQGFSRQQIDNCVTLPDKVLQCPPRQGYTPHHIIEYHRQSGTFPKPFSMTFSDASPSRDQAHLSANTRESILNVSPNKSRFSVFSINSHVDGSPTIGTARKVKQIFDPVLPDELLIRAGESLTLVQSFDDGWCLVGRENTSFVATAKSLFRPNTVTGDGIELGVVPAWCFVKPAPGLRAGRPVRSTSLGITVQLNADEAAPRNNIISWSNF